MMASSGSGSRRVRAAPAAPPQPSSTTRTKTRPSVLVTQTLMRSAWACFTALATASLTTKEAVVATSSGNQSARTSMSTATGTVRIIPASVAERPSSKPLGRKGDLPQLRHRGAQLDDALVEQSVDIDAALAEVSLGEPGRHAQGGVPDVTSSRSRVA